MEKAYGVAYLKPDQIRLGVEHIMTLVDSICRNGVQEFGNRLLDFGSYLRRFWVPLARVMSVNGQSVKTNNTCENYHMHARRIFGIHPGIWDFLSMNFILKYYIACI